jgi:ribose transport system permease protein
MGKNGNIIRRLRDPKGKYVPEITSAQEHQGYLYLGALYPNKIGRYKLLQD